MFVMLHILTYPHPIFPLRALHCSDLIQPVPAPSRTIELCCIPSCCIVSHLAAALLCAACLILSITLSFCSHYLPLIALPPTTPTRAPQHQHVRLSVIKSRTDRVTYTSPGVRKAFLRVEGTGWHSNALLHSPLLSSQPSRLYPSPHSIGVIWIG